MNAFRKRPAYRLALLAAFAVLALLVLAGPAAAALTITYNHGFLDIVSDGDDAIAITCVGGNVKINGADPPSGAAACEDIVYIKVFGGPGSNIIDLGAVTSPKFVGIGPAQFFTQVEGGGGDDVITGSEFSDFISGGDGNDTLNGGAGDDFVRGDGGDDAINGGAGNDDLYGSFLGFQPGTKTVNGGNGSDTLTVSGSSGPDTLTATTADGTLSAGASSTSYQAIENFRISGGDGDDTITTGAGRDDLGGGFGNDTLNAGAGDDTLSGAPGTDTANGESGTDRLNFGGTAGADTLTFTAPNGTLSTGASNTVNYTGIDNVSITGGQGDDTLTGADGADVLVGGGGNDTLNGGGGNDGLAGDVPFEPAGNDTLNGGDGDDKLGGHDGNDTINGGAGDDFAEGDGLFFSTAPGEDVLNGGPGNDTLYGLSEFCGIEPRTNTVNGDAGDDQLDPCAQTGVADGGDGNDTLTFRGSSGPDTLTATVGSGTLSGGANSTSYQAIENFSIFGENGDDMITTGSGRDFLSGDGGSDTLTGGAGDDRLAGNFDAAGGPAVTNTIHGGDGSDTLEFYGSDGNDTLSATSQDGTLSAGSKTDNFTSMEDFQIFGFAGDDAITTGSGADYVDTGLGDDSVTTGAGDDTINLYGGNDNVDGKAGSDRYQVSWFGSLGIVTIADSGPLPRPLVAVGDEDTLAVSACAGVTVTETQLVKGLEVVNYSGIETRPCGYTPTPPPPPVEPPPPVVPPPPAVDSTPPAIAPTITGRVGRRGWYTGPVQISWSVTDPESQVGSTSGCETRTIAADTRGMTITCQATSAGGTVTRAVSVKVDVKTPTISCKKAGFVYGQTGAVVYAAVSDRTSGPARSKLSRGVSTKKAGSRPDPSFTAKVKMTGSDLAGNSASRNCSYSVTSYPWMSAVQLGDAKNSDYGYTKCPSNASTCKGKTMLYKGQVYGLYDPWGYYFRNCTSYVAWRLGRLGVSAAGYGNGGQWYKRAGEKGVKRGTTPKAGAAAVKEGDPGHVAYVEAVHKDGTITVSEYNQRLNGKWGTRRGKPSALGLTKFVYFR